MESKDLEAKNDETLDTVIALVVIIAAVAGVTFWLAGMPA